MGVAPSWIAIAMTMTEEDVGRSENAQAQQAGQQKSMASVAAETVTSSRLVLHKARVNDWRGGA